MKVKELIEKLSKCDQELEVTPEYDSGVGNINIEVVYERVIDTKINGIVHYIGLSNQDILDYLLSDPEEYIKEIIE